MYIILTLVLILFMIFFIPIRLNINYGVKPKNNKSNKTVENVNNSYQKNNYVIIKLLYYIPICKIKLENDKSQKDKSLNNKNKASSNSKKTPSTSNVKNKSSKTKSQKNYIVETLYSLFMEILGYQNMKKAYLSKSDVNNILKNIHFEKLYLKLGVNLKDPIVNSYLAVSLNTILCMYINKNINRFNLNHLYYKVYISDSIYKVYFNGILRFNLANTIGIACKVMYKILKLKSRKVVKKDGRTSNRKSNDDFHDVARKYD